MFDVLHCLVVVFHLKTRGHSPTLPKELLLVDSMQMAARNAAALYLTMVDLTGSI